MYPKLTYQMNQCHKDNGALWLKNITQASNGPIREM